MIDSNPPTTSARACEGYGRPAFCLVCRHPACARCAVKLEAIVGDWLARVWLGPTLREIRELPEVAR